MTEYAILTPSETDDAPVPDFTPVPVTRARHDGWSAHRQRRFIAALDATGVVGTAAGMVGMTGRSAYRLRNRPQSESFAAAWDHALNSARHRALDVAMEMALQRHAVARYYRGRFVGMHCGFDNRMLLAALRAASVIAPGKRGKGHE